MDELPARVRAVCDLDVAEAREYSGRHEYDGKIQDLSPGGVRDGLARLAAAAASGGRLDDPHDESHLAAFERRAQVAYGELELHRQQPAGSSRPRWTWPATTASTRRRGERERAKLQHLALWPQAVDAALASLDQVSAPVASALISGIRGLAAGIPPTAPADVAARAARPRTPGWSRTSRRRPADGDPDAALGAAGLRSLMSTLRGHRRRSGPARRAGRRRAGPAAEPAGRGLRPDRRQPAAAGAVPGPGP